MNPMNTKKGFDVNTSESATKEAKMHEKLQQLPYVKTWVEMSEDGKYLLHKRLETSIYSEKYMDKVYKGDK